LIEIKEIILEEFPYGFPPIRSISLQIDFIRGSNLPNKSPHMMPPIKSEEFNKQVHELFEGGLITDILSPCAIPTVIAPREGGEWRNQV
jgi:hypothetical protein